MNTAVYSHCAEEAISALGLLKPAAVGIIIGLLPECVVNHPRSLTTAYRKEGEQLSRDEKRGLGLRSNSFLSRKAASELTEAGALRPIEAHEITLLRAHFSTMRYLAAARAPNLDAECFRYDTISSQCPGCRRLKDVQVSAAEIDPSQPFDCEREACPMMVRPEIDYIARGLAKYRARIGQ